MRSLIDPTNRASTVVDLEIGGTLPAGLCGRLFGVGREGSVHSVHFRDGRASYVAYRIDTPPRVVDVVAFEGAILVYGDDSSIRQLTTATGDVRSVDVAGHRRTVASCPRFDPARGELHIVAREWDDSPLHVVVPAGALTRSSRPIVGAPARVEGLAVTDDHVVFFADGFVGVAPRDGEGAITWVNTGVAAPRSVHSFRRVNTLVLVALTPSLERWTIHPASSTVHREVLDPTPQRFARFGHRQPGDLAFVADPARPHLADGGWLAGFVNDTSSPHAELVLFDAVDISRPAVATVRIPRPVPVGLRATWMPAISQHPLQGDRP
jgi:carotenoid cleavage dioxygenase-like enzyme